MKEADITILCLPDHAAIRAVEIVAGKDIRIIDASSAHRSANGWVYGFAELHPDQSRKIAEANLEAMLDVMRLGLSLYHARL